MNTSENDLEPNYKREFKEDKYSHGRKEKDENNNSNNYDSDKSKESSIMNFPPKRDLKRSRDDDDYTSRSTYRRSDNRFDESRSSRNLSPRNDSFVVDSSSFLSKYEIGRILNDVKVEIKILIIIFFFNTGEKIDFLEYHKSNGHCDNEVLEKQAQKQKIEIINRTDCENCLNHKMMINCLKGKLKKN